MPHNYHSHMHMPTASEFRAEADQKHIPIAAICRVADVDAASFYRWAQGKDVTVGTVAKLIKALNTMLQRPAPRKRK